MWNYRVFKSEINGRDHYCLKEAFYDDAGNVHSWTEDTESGYFEDIEHLVKTHEMMLADIIKYKELVLNETELLKKFESDS
jgi:hypothetical protein